VVSGQWLVIRDSRLTNGGEEACGMAQPEIVPLRSHD
jgi:hypothetical protein